MINPCENCPDFSTCDEPCSKLELMLPRDIEPDLDSFFRKEIPVSQTKTAKKKASNDSRAVTTIADIEKQRADNNQSDFESNNPETLLIKKTMPGNTVKDNKSKKVNECIKNTIKNYKVRTRYRSYLGCEKMTAIAKRAGVTRKTIQKQFVRITRKISKMYEKRYGEKVSNNPFKLKKAGGACRIELKK